MWCAKPRAVTSCGTSTRPLQRENGVILLPAGSGIANLVATASPGVDDQSDVQFEEAASARAKTFPQRPSAEITRLPFQVNGARMHAQHTGSRSRRSAPTTRRCWRNADSHNLCFIGGAKGARTVTSLVIADESSESITGTPVHPESGQIKNQELLKLSNASKRDDATKR